MSQTHRSDVQSIDEDATLFDAVEQYEDLLESEVGDTPLVRSRRLERAHGVRMVYLKLDGDNPTGTHKDRIAWAQAMELALVHVGDPDPARAAVAAVVCGGLVEEGADGRGALVPVASRLLRLLADAAEAEDWDDPGWMALDWFYRPVVAILSRERDLAETPQAMALSEPAELLASEHPGMAHLYRLLRVADVPLLVIDPVSVKGWRVLTRGISDNFQLHVLLLDLFADELGLEPPPGEVVRTALGDGPQETAAVVSGAWDLLAWSAIGEDGALPDVVDEVHWVWNEQVPGDIPEFGGERVLLLGPASCERTWNNARTFEALGAEVSVVERLELGRVAERLARMARRRA